MRVKLSKPVFSVLSILSEASYEAYVVGGAVRDLLLGAETADWDFTTSATPEQILALFPDGFYDNAYGTVGVAGKHLLTTLGSTDSEESLWEMHGWKDEVFEITTFRHDEGYSNNRHPDSVTWGKTVEDDLARRDFTVNALALKIDPSQLENADHFITVEATIIDPFDGQYDLSRKVIRAVGDANERFSEDALRMMRAIRFGAQLGFAIDPLTLGAIQKNAHLITRISWERISSEFLKIISSQFCADGITLLYASGVLAHILPEALLMRGVPQAGRHKLDVWNHSLESLRECPSTDPIVRLAAFLHDIGKPKSYREQGPRGITFYGHEVIGARMADIIGKRLRLSKKQVEKLVTLVRWHMFAYESKMTDASIRRFIKRVGVENINDMMLLRVGDRKGGGSKATSWRLQELQRRIGEQLFQPMTLRDLTVDGTDVMNELAIPPSRKIGEVMNKLFDEVMEDPRRNKREYLLNRIRELA